jgi:hypothetical protein
MRVRSRRRIDPWRRSASDVDADLGVVSDRNQRFRSQVSRLLAEFREHPLQHPAHALEPAAEHTNRRVEVVIGENNTGAIAARS